MVEDLKPSDLPTYRIVTTEALAYLAFGLCYPFGLIKDRKRTPRQKEQRTVVFIHGYLANGASFLPLSAYLRSIGISTTLSFNYRSQEGVERAAIRLREFLKHHVRGGRIDLVCHSLGGVIARSYIQELGGSRRVDRCITLGTPHLGTYTSYWLTSRVGQELRPDSALLSRLAKSKCQAGNVKFASIVGQADNIIVPRVFAADTEDVAVIPHVGHVGLLYSPKAYLEIARRLTGSN